jgi:hypothetical protein
MGIDSTGPTAIAPMTRASAHPPPSSLGVSSHTTASRAPPSAATAPRLAPPAPCAAPPEVRLEGAWVVKRAGKVGMGVAKSSTSSPASWRAASHAPLPTSADASPRSRTVAVSSERSWPPLAGPAAAAAGAQSRKVAAASTVSLAVGMGRFGSVASAPPRLLASSAAAAAPSSNALSASCPWARTSSSTSTSPSASRPNTQGQTRARRRIRNGIHTWQKGERMQRTER